MTGCCQEHRHHSRDTRSDQGVLFNLLTKFLQPTQGTIAFNGIEITNEEPVQIARCGVIRSFQISATFGHMTALENVRVALQRKLGTSLHFWRQLSSLNPLNERATELLEAVDLGSYARTLASEMPYGRKRALEIATTLAHGRIVATVQKDELAAKTEMLHELLGV